MHGLHQVQGFQGAAGEDAEVMSNPIYWGADPGLTGAICAVEFRNNKPVEAQFVVPEIEYTYSMSGRRHGRIVIPRILASCRNLARAFPPQEVVLEKVGAFPGQGVNAVFSFGFIAGVFETAIASCSTAPITYLTPRDWKVMLNLTLVDADKTEKKKLAIAVANEYVSRNPILKMPPFRQKEDGKAEAFLLACCGIPSVVEEIRVIAKHKNNFGKK